MGFQLNHHLQLIPLRKIFYKKEFNQRLTIVMEMMKFKLLKSQVMN